MKTLIIIRGCPGDGKTTLAKKISGAHFHSIAADDMPELYLDGQYQNHGVA
jgi:adenylate kinase family enzyme